MGKRREGREAAVQLLFHWDMNVRQPFEKADLNGFWQLRTAIQAPKEFATRVAAGVIAEQGTIDEKIRRYTANYELKRISAVDRNILGVAIYEIVFSNDVPPIIAINEAIDIAKKFGTEESGKVGNGGLVRVNLYLTRP